MEPRRSRRGDGNNAGKENANTAGLQWSHDVTVVEMIVRLALNRGLHLGFNGATTSPSWRSGTYEARPPKDDNASWSHDVTVVEMVGKKS